MARFELAKQKYVDNIQLGLGLLELKIQEYNANYM